MSIEKDWFINYQDVTSIKMTGDGMIARYRAGLFGEKKPGDDEKERQSGGRGAAGGAKVVSEAKVGGIKMTMFGGQG